MSFICNYLWSSNSWMKNCFKQHFFFQCVHDVICDYFVVILGEMSESKLVIRSLMEHELVLRDVCECVKRWGMFCVVVVEIMYDPRANSEFSFQLLIFDTKTQESGPSLSLWVYGCVTDWKRVWVAVGNHIDRKESMAEELTAVFIKPAACWKSNLVLLHSFRGR